MDGVYVILENIAQYSVDELAAALKGVGIVNFDEFKGIAREAGVPLRKTLQEQLKEKMENAEEDAWDEAVRINTIDGYQHYLDTCLEGKHREEARDNQIRLNKILQEQNLNSAWANVDKGDIGALQLFINNNPESQYVAEANSLIGKLNEEQSEEKWSGVNKRDLASLQSFITNYPNSSHRIEALNLIRDLSIVVDMEVLAQQIKAIYTNPNVLNPENAICERIVSCIESGQIEEKDLLEAIANDHNFISSRVAYMLFEKGIITDYSRAGIDQDFQIKMMTNTTAVTFQSPEPLTCITSSPCTEVYFWGIPSSGKSCALGAILSSANSGEVATSMERDNNCQGYGYMNRLANVFRKKGIGVLPEGTAISSTYEMGFTLEDKDGYKYPITCIDLAGELIRCMYKNDAGEPLTNEQATVLRTLTNILVDNRTKNRKIHFFVIEYGAEDREYEGLPQGNYLDAAVAYIRRTGIFKNDTDGLYLLITKVDKAKATSGEQLEQILKDYIIENYHGFYNGLKSICRINEINGGNVEILPFTLGTVCFQNYCKFDDECASNIVRLLLKRSYKFKPGKRQRFLNKLMN